MECAGIIEAGGVKDVTFSLCENFSKVGNDVTLFIPVFGTNSFENLKNVKENAFSSEISLCGQTHVINYTTAEFINFPVKVVLINHLAFSEKKAVYVYTALEQEKNPNFVRGMGHLDAHFLDATLSKAVAAFGTLLPDNFIPDIIHCQDASTAITPCYIDLLRPNYYNETKCYVTIHNAGPAYHHEFKNINEAMYYTELPWNWLQEALNVVRIEPFLLAALKSILTTVSTFYAEELINPNNSKETDGLSDIFYSRKIKIFGITNGIDYFHYAPEYPEISELPYSFNPRIGQLDGKYKNRDYFLNLCKKDLSENEKANRFLSNISKYGYLDSEKNKNEFVYFVYHGRIVGQKGIFLLIDVMNILLKEYSNIRFIIMGQGETYIENSLKEFVKNFEGKIVYFKGYNKCMPRLCVAAADYSILPSNFEPCCLEDFISQIYGTIPIAHATGGLKKIIDGETGFLYSNNTVDELKIVIEKSIDFRLNKYSILKDMIYLTSNFIKDIYSWEFVIREKYLKLFEKRLKYSKNNIDSFSSLV